MTRSSFACAAGARSDTSSRNNVPPFACSNLPRRPRTPVAVRSSMPNSSASSSVSTIAAQFSATKGPSRRGLNAWIWRATSSFPVPDSPSISTVNEVAATRAMCSRSRRIARLEPMSPPGTGPTAPGTGPTETPTPGAPEISASGSPLAALITPSF